MAQQPSLLDLDPDEISVPDIEKIEIEDGLPVDNFQSEKQQRLLVDSVYSCSGLSVPFIAAANVGVFYGINQEPLVPDIFLSLNVKMPHDWSQKKNRSYFVWEFGKPPEVCIEVVSNKKGKELDDKKLKYAQLGCPYYAVFDPLEQLQRPDQMNGALLQVFVLNGGRYHELHPPFWLETVGLGLMLWQGEFESQFGLWLRWCNRQGQLIPTGKERAEQEAQRAEQEAQRAEQEAQRAEQEAQRADRLAQQLRAMGIDPNQI